MDRTGLRDNDTEAELRAALWQLGTWRSTAVVGPEQTCRRLIKPFFCQHTGYTK